MRLACHQPNFMPYGGFWEKAASVDLFVLLGHCQFEKGKYQNRFHIGADWFTMSVKHGMVPIREKVYANPAEDWVHICDRIGGDLIAQFTPHISPSLWDTNTGIILQAAKSIAPLTRWESDFHTDQTGTGRLIEICRHFGASTYLAGSSGSDYMDIEQFRKAGIAVEVQDAAKTDKRPMLEILKHIK